MKKVLLFLTLFVVGNLLSAQQTGERIRQAFNRFMADSQLKHAAVSLYVIDAKTGQPVFDVNSQMGLAPASTQKIITSVTAFELLGKEYRYMTAFGYTGKITNNNLIGNLVVLASGDPTFGSGRWGNTGAAQILNQQVNALVAKNVKSISGNCVYITGDWAKNKVPDGWVWQDIGSYYGAGAAPLNWRENQYDLFLRSGSKIGDSVLVVRTEPEQEMSHFISTATAAGKGTGDNAYIYFPLGMGRKLITGTIPVNEKDFSISGAMDSPGYTYYTELFGSLDKKGIRVSNGKWSTREIVEEDKLGTTDKFSPLVVHYSPSLDSIIYWFNKKSINLYGEALVKTFALEKQGYASTDSGVAILRRFWKDKGLDPEELNMYDGSGLSPLNRVTTHAQVEILKYAKSRSWFPAFYDALPEYNGMKMKSGTISDVKGYCGYHKAKDGREYIFSFLINNYSGKTAPVVSKMFKVLDELK